MSNWLLQVTEGLDKIRNFFQTNRLLRKSKAFLSEVSKTSTISASSGAKNDIKLMVYDDMWVLRIDIFYHYNASESVTSEGLDKLDTNLVSLESRIHAVL